jgi:hypothetical protein
MESKKYWDKFYLLDSNHREGSSFSQLVASMGFSPSLVIDVGCGDGRDSLALSSAFGCRVLGLDSSSAAILKAESRVEPDAAGVSPDFVKFTIGRDAPSQILSELGSGELGELLIYSRFFLHSLTELEESFFWELVGALASATGSPSFLALEYRSVEDALRPKSTPSHYRRYINPEEVSQSAHLKGFEKDFEESGIGFSIVGVDDAFLTRQIFASRRDV